MISFRCARVSEWLSAFRLGSAHIVHAHGGDGFHARIYLGRADDEAAAAANPDRTNSLSVDK